MPWNLSDKPTGLERVIAVLCYLTAGLAGIIYIILNRQSYQSNFFRFHFLQSVILGIIGLLVSWSMGAFEMVSMPLFEFLNGLIPNVGGQIANGIVMVVAAIRPALALLGVYALILAALGKYAEIPFISDVVRQQLR